MSSNEALLASFELRDKDQSINHRLAPRVIFYILLFSSFITLFATALQLYLEYSRDVREIDDRMAQIEQSYLNSIALSLWIMDYEQLRLQLEGIQALPDMQYLEVESDGETLLTVGQKPATTEHQRSYRLTHQYRGDLLELGILRVAADFDNVYQRLLDRVLVIFASQAVKTFLVAGFIFIIIQMMITRHLQRISDHVRSMRLGRPMKPLSLARQRRSNAMPDELDDVVHAISRLSEHLVASYKRLAESEERFDLAMRGTNDGLWDWSLETDSAYYSPRCAEILGMSPDELSESPYAWQVHLPPDDRSRFREQMRRHLKGETPNFECIFRLSCGSTTRWLWSRGQALRRSNGRAYRMVGTHTDITVQKENEAALAAANQRLQEEQEKRAEAQRLACIGELSASIAHEIRNPLASIVNSLELLVIDELPTDERHSLTEIVNSETRQLQRILNDFLDFSRQRPAERVHADIIATLTDAVSALTMAVEQGPVIDIRFEPHAAHCLADFDIDQMRQVIWNITLNAVHAMPDGGVLRIYTHIDEDRVYIHVVDSGCGIASDMLDKVTRPFVSKREDGTGLGLAVVKRILEQHDSRLVIRSEVDRGTDVEFSLATLEGV